VTETKEEGSGPSREGAWSDLASTGQRQGGKWQSAFVVHKKAPFFFNFVFSIQYSIGLSLVIRHASAVPAKRPAGSMDRNISKKLIILTAANLVVAGQPNLTPQIVRSGSCHDD
jgi:hypothetical protein